MKFLSSASLLALAFSAATVAAQDVDRTGWPTSFTVGTASQGGTFFVYGSGWANLVAEELGITGAGEVTGGPMQNMALVHTGDLAFGLTTLGPAAESLAGTNPIAPGLAMDNVCAMFPMYQTPFHLAALESEGITTLSDIPAGSVIGFGPAGSSADTYFPLMLEALGVSFERRNGGWDDLGGQMQDGLIDAIGFAAGVPIPTVSQLEVQTDISIVGFTDDELATVTANFPVSAFEVAPTTYQSLDEPLTSVAMWNFAIANCDLPETFVHEATRIAMEDNARMVTIHNSARESLPEHWDKNNVLKWHPGAARWFNENGASIPADMIHGG
jgi:TRAP transporter TAXI family solute receptor